MYHFTFKLLIICVCKTVLAHIYIYTSNLELCKIITYIHIVF